MSQTADRKQPYLRWHEVLFSIYCSFVFVLLEESRPYAWSTRLRYYYFWHPHAVALRGIDIDLFYLELFLIPAVAFFVGLRLLSRFSFLQVFLRTASGAIALAAFPLIPLYRATSPLLVLVFTFAIATACSLLWIYGKWPVSTSLTIVLLILYYGLFMVLGLDPRTGWLREAWLICSALGFAYTLVWGKYFRETRRHELHESSIKIGMRTSEP